MRRTVAVLVLVGLVAVSAVVAATVLVMDDSDRRAGDVTNEARAFAEPPRKTRPPRRERAAVEFEAVRGRVLVSGRPRGDMRVWVDGVETVTDEQGRFEVRDRPKGKHRIVYGGGKYLAQEAVIESGDTIDVRLRWPRKREGRLVLPDGVSADGVRLYYRVRGGDLDQNVTADATGRFGHERLQPSGHYVTFPSQKIGDRAFYRKSVLAGRFSRDTTVIEPPPGDVISGVVVAPDGRPVANARVDARGKWPRTSTSNIAGALTDRDGRFELIVPAGVVTSLIASAPGDQTRGNRYHAAAELQIEPPAGDVSITLAPGRTVEGVILDPDGEPFPNATIEFRVEHSAYSWVPRVRARTDRRGRFVAGGLSVRRLRVRFMGRETVARGLLLDAAIAANAKNIELRTQPSLRLRGRIIRAADVEGQAVRFGFVGPDGRLDIWRPLHKSGKFDFGSKPPGTYTVRVAIGNMSRRPRDRRTCGTIEAGAEPVDLQMPPAD